MPGPLLYRPPPRWQFWAALGGAIGIHLASVGIAAMKHEPAVVDLSNIPTATVEAMLQPEDQPTPPPEDIPIPEPPPIPEVAPEFHKKNRRHLKTLPSRPVQLRRRKQAYRERCQSPVQRRWQFMHRNPNIHMKQRAVTLPAAALPS